MSFRDLVCSHLSQYRLETLGIREEGAFLHRGVSHPKGHILPKGRERLNLIAPYGESFFASHHASIKLHQYFHHLNSSQALCINLFYPLLEERCQALLLRSLGSQMSQPVTGVFESESTLEDAVRRTSFDFHLRNEDDQQLFVEVKYTEDGFGGAAADSEHLDKFRRTYAPLLEGSKYLVSECNRAEFFLGHYQVLRNLVHIGDSSEVVFLFPRANPKVAEEAEYARRNLLTDFGRERMRIIVLEDLVTALIDACAGTQLDEYYRAFRHKYLGYAA